MGLPFSEKDEATLNHLCTTCQFGPGQEDESEERTILSGLCPDLFGDFGVIARIQYLVNYFSRYQVLKDYDDKSPLLAREYSDACIKLETLRKEFRLPARFKYNKTKRKDNPFFKGGVEVVIPDEPIPARNVSAPAEGLVQSEHSAEESQ